MSEPERQKILILVEGFAELKYSQTTSFVPGETPVPH